LGSRSFTGGTTHAAGYPSTFGASWPLFTSSLKANLVTVERLHGSGSNTVIDCGEPFRSEKERGDEANARRKRKGARCSGAEARSKDDGR
jgi:hypothetical protein